MPGAGRHVLAREPEGEAGSRSKQDSNQLVRLANTIGKALPENIRMGCSWIILFHQCQHHALLATISLTVMVRKSHTLRRASRLGMLTVGSAWELNRARGAHRSHSLPTFVRAILCVRTARPRHTGPGMESTGTSIPAGAWGSRRRAPSCYRLLTQAQTTAHPDSAGICMVAVAGEQDAAQV